MDVDDEQVVTGGGDGSIRQWKIGDQQKTSGGFINMLIRFSTLLFLHEVFWSNYFKEYHKLYTWHNLVAGNFVSFKAPLQITHQV